MNGPCDFVLFNYYSVIVLSIIITSVVCTKKLSVSFNKVRCVGSAIKWYIAVMSNDYSIYAYMGEHSNRFCKNMLV